MGKGMTESQRCQRWSGLPVCSPSSRCKPSLHGFWSLGVLT